jgi:hypothetical protein
LERNHADLWARPRIAVTFVAVRLPVQWLEIVRVVGSAAGDRLFMIDFPAVFRVRVSVLTSFDYRAAGVLAIRARITTRNLGTFLPDRFNGSIAESSAVDVSVSLSCHINFLSSKDCSRLDNPEGVIVVYSCIREFAIREVDTI